MGRVYHGFQLKSDGRDVVVASFVDTGSDRTIISNRVARRLGLRPAGKERVVTASGHRLLARSGKVRVVSKLDGIDSIFKVLITDAPFKADPDENIDMIVGLDFLQAHHVRLGFGK
jgi:predicted aspartyl protease